VEIDVQNARIELRKNETKDWWENVSDSEKKAVELGIADADARKVKPNSEAKEIYGKWV